MPAYDEAEQVERSIGMIARHLEATGESWELIVVDDGSRDGTGDAAERVGAIDRRVRLVRHGRNLGVGQAIATGVAAARGEWFMVIPADLAMDLRDLPRYLEARDGVAVVAGYTASRPDYGRWRGLVSIANRRAVAWLAGVRVRNPNYIHMYKLDAIRAAPLRYAGSAALFAEMLSRAAAYGRIVEIPIRYVPRTRGRATGAKWSLIARTARDLVRLRLGW